ncbi:hypothetical protein CSB09_00130 [Candidatus Gracilibacteria bacterium]|nr:MAG: hypothetical protein CSB09_00130 [Candidatus Gracilibacteria bacterium]
MSNKKIYSNSLAQIAGKVMTALISIFLIKIISGLGLEAYGIYGKVYNYLAIFAVLADFGLYTITVREISKHQDDPKMVQKISGNILCLRTISALIIIVITLVGAFFLPGYHSLALLISIFIVGLFTLLGLVNSSMMSYLQAILKTEFSFFATTAGKLLTFILILLAVYGFFPYHPSLGPEYQMIWIFSAGLAGNLLMTAMTWWYANKQQKVIFAWDSDFIKKTLKETLPYGIALFLGVIFFKVDIFLLSVMEPENIADTVTGLYQLPLKIVDVGMLYGTVFLNSLLPVLSPAIKEKQHTKVLTLTSKGFEILTSFGIGIAVFLFFYAFEIISLLSRSEIANEVIYGHTAVDVLAIVSWIFLFYFVGSLANFILIARGEQSKLLVINSVLASVNIIGNILLIPHFHFMGAAGVTLFTQILFFGIMWYLVRNSFENKKNITWMLAFLIVSLFGVYISRYLADGIFPTSELGQLLFGAGFFGIWFFGSWFLLRKIKF